MANPRFKIDYSSSYRPFGLFVREQRMFLPAYWRLIDSFSTQEEAKAFYDKIKDLPEYLA